MKDAIYAVTIGLPIWWAAQAMLSLRDYFRRRSEIRRMPPASGEEKRAIVRAVAQAPQKERRSFRWYIDHPRDAVAHGWIFIPVFVLFWPMALLLLTMPPLESRLSQEMIARLNSEGS